MHKTIFKHKGKVIASLNHRRHNLRAIVESLIAKGIYCQINRVCEYEFDTHVFITIVKGVKQQAQVLNIAEQFDNLLETRRTLLPIYRTDENAS